MSDDVHSENEWDDEDDATEQAQQHERDARHNDQSGINVSSGTGHTKHHHHHGQQHEVIPIQPVIQTAVPPIRQQSTEDEDFSDSSDSDESAPDEEAEKLQLKPLPKLRATPSSSPPAALSTGRSSAPSSITRLSPLTNEPSPTAAASSSKSLPSAILEDAMANPPPPPMPSPSNVKKGNVITLSLKKEHGGDVKIKSERMDEDEEDTNMDDEDEIDYEGDAEADLDAAIKDEDLAAAMDEDMEESSGASPSVKIEVDAKPSSNKLTFTIPRSSPSVRVSSSNSVTQPAGVPNDSTVPTMTKQPPAGLFSSTKDAVDEPDDVLYENRKTAAVIPPTTGITPQGKTVLERYRRYFFDREQEWPAMPIQYISGREVTDHYIRTTGLRTPLIATSSKELGMKLPDPSPTVRDVITALPPDHELSVIDVATQTESGEWTLKQWLDYYETPASERTATCNVISLEISNTDYAKQNLLSPKFVRDIDWMRLWPTEIPLAKPPAIPNIESMAATESSTAASTTSTSSSVAPPPATASTLTTASLPYLQKIPRPIAVQLYCLMGVGGSYTDFHADFGGSSVWYHVVRGEKIFLVIEPTAENLKIYEEWQQKGKSLTTFLPDLYAARDRADGRNMKLNPTVRILSVKASQTLFLPSGWIHAVYTPVDSLVFGGNFLHSYHIQSQLMIYNLELNTHIEARFKFPNFESLQWLVMRSYVFQLREPLAQLKVTLWELHGLATLVKTAAWWMHQAMEGMKYGLDASRPRLGSKEEHLLPTTSPQEPSETHWELSWPHNIPFEWKDAITLLRELDILITYNVYLIEREEYDDSLETKPQPSSKSSAASASSSTDSKLSASGWLHREQLATKCFQELQRLKTSTYPFVEMVDPYSYPWLKKIKKVYYREAEDVEELKLKLEHESTPVPLLPTTSGRTRQHVAKYNTSEFLSDSAFDADESKMQDETKTASSATVEGASSKKRARPMDDEDENAGDASDEDFDVSSDDDEFVDESGEDEEYGESKAPPKKKTKTSSSSAATSSSTSLPPAAFIGGNSMADIRARAKAAAAASMSQSKKVILATESVPKKRPTKAGAATTKPAAAATKKTKPPGPQLSAKQRIMQKLGLSGKFR